MIDYDKLWAEIDSFVEEEYSRKKSYERTISEFAKLWSMSDEKTEEIVNKLVQEGKLTSRFAISNNGKRAMVYAPVECNTK